MEPHNVNADPNSASEPPPIAERHSAADTVAQTAGGLAIGTIMLVIAVTVVLLVVVAVALVVAGVFR